VKSLMIKIGAIVLAQHLLAIVKRNYTRWVIRQITPGELPAWRFFNPEFLLGLNWTQVFMLCSIAVFTIATFPLGIWLGSFKIGVSYSVFNMLTGIITLCSFPITLYIMSRVLEEFRFNNLTWLGIGAVTLGKIVIILGCYFMYLGNRGA